MSKEFTEIIGGGLFSTVIEIDESKIFRPSQSDIEKVNENKRIIERLKTKKGKGKNHITVIDYKE